MRISAVIVSYHPPPSLKALCEQLLSQVDRLYLVDNASEPETVQALQQLADQSPDHVRLIANHSNLGLAAAQNQGIRQALEDGCEWVLLMDDDSMPAPDMVTRLLEATRKVSQIGIIAPRLVDSSTNTAHRYVIPKFGVWLSRHLLNEDEILDNTAWVIASGSLIRAELFHAVGFMNETWFIDSIDHDFCLRARRAGYGIRVVGNATLFHAQGQKQHHGLGIYTNNHSSNRRYYIFRNRCFMIRSHGQHFPFVLVHELLACVWDLTRIVLMESQKFTKIKAALRGLRDGITTPVKTTASPIS